MARRSCCPITWVCTTGFWTTNASRGYLASIRRSVRQASSFGAREARRAIADDTAHLVQRDDLVVGHDGDPAVQARVREMFERRDVFASQDDAEGCPRAGFPARHWRLSQGIR
jgi:hypothetical protein